MTFEDWWEQFSAEHEDWRYADSEALRKAAFKAGAASERIITMQDDDSLRFIKRVLEGAQQTDSDKAKCLEMIYEIRTRIRGGYAE